MQHGFCSLMILFWINVMANAMTKNKHKYCILNICLPRTSRNTYWIVDPFTQVKSAKYMVKSKTKSISNLGTFYNFSKTKRSIYNFLKIPVWNWNGSYLFCYGAWVQKESAKLQNMRACTDKTGLSSIKLVWLIQKAGWSADQRNLKMSAEWLPLSRLI